MPRTFILNSLQTLTSLNQLIIKPGLDLGSFFLLQFFSFCVEVVLRERVAELACFKQGCCKWWSLQSKSSRAALIKSSFTSVIFLGKQTAQILCPLARTVWWAQTFVSGLLTTKFFHRLLDMTRCCSTMRGLGGFCSHLGKYSSKNANFSWKHLLPGFILEM